MKAPSKPKSIKPKRDPRLGRGDVGIYTETGILRMILHRDGSTTSFVTISRA